MTGVILALTLLFVPQSAPDRKAPATRTGSAKKTPSPPALEQIVIAKTKKLSARSLDPELPDQPFAEWLQSVVGKDVKVAWESNDCGEQTGDPNTTPAEFPICGQASAKLSGARTVTVMVAIGSNKQGITEGITGGPRVFFVGLDIEATFETVNSLHDLPAAISNSTPRP
jgi:hypothetical protein